MRLRNKLLSAVFGFALGVGGFAAAQIVTSFQLSQDGRGAFGTNTVGTTTGYHFLIASNPPVLTSCGTAPAIVGNDSAGLITTGSAAGTTCTATFQKAWVTAPNCVITAQAQATQPTFTTSTTAITFTTTIASTAYAYFCTSTG